MKLLQIAFQFETADGTLVHAAWDGSQVRVDPVFKPLSSSEIQALKVDVQRMVDQFTTIAKL